MADPVVQVDNSEIVGLAKQIDEARKRLGKEKRRAHKEVAEQVAPVARAHAVSGSPMERHFAAAIQPRSTQTYARIAVAGERSKKGKSKANAAFFGAKGRAGWNLGWYKGELRPRRYLGGRPQFQEWVGASWAVGVRGEGPYAINDAIASFGPRIDDLYLEAHERALRAAGAFPGGFT